MSRIAQLEFKLKQAIETLTSIASLDYPDQIKIDYWMATDQINCAKVLATDTNLARVTLDAINTEFPDDPKDLLIKVLQEEIEEIKQKAVDNSCGCIRSMD